MPRIRRELRTLSEAEREAFFDAIKLMRNTSDASGVQKYGKSAPSACRMLPTSQRCSPALT